MTFTQREQIAAMCLQGILAGNLMLTSNHKSYIEHAVELADELIKKLNESNPVKHESYCLPCEGTGTDSTGFYKCRHCNKSENK